jgi:hypothetical protein
MYNKILSTKKLRKKHVSVLVIRESKYKLAFNFTNLLIYFNPIYFILF